MGATFTYKLRIRFAWWMWPVLCLSYPLILVGSMHQPAAVERAVARIAERAIRVRVVGVHVVQRQARLAEALRRE